jgi:hypothetical protein
VEFLLVASLLVLKGVSDFGAFSHFEISIRNAEPI